MNDEKSIIWRTIKMKLYVVKSQERRKQNQSSNAFCVVRIFRVRITCFDDFVDLVSL